MVHGHSPRSFTGVFHRGLSPGHGDCGHADAGPPKLRLGTLSPVSATSVNLLAAFWRRGAGNPDHLRFAAGVASCGAALSAPSMVEEPIGCGRFVVPSRIGGSAIPTLGSARLPHRAGVP